MNTDKNLDFCFPVFHAEYHGGFVGPSVCHSERSEESITTRAGDYVFGFFAVLRMTEAWKVRLTASRILASRVRFSPILFLGFIRGDRCNPWSIHHHE